MFFSKCCGNLGQVFRSEAGTDDNKFQFAPLIPTASSLSQLRIPFCVFLLAFVTPIKVLLANSRAKNIPCILLYLSMYISSCWLFVCLLLNQPASVLAPTFHTAQSDLGTFSVNHFSNNRRSYLVKLNQVKYHLELRRILCAMFATETFPSAKILDHNEQYAEFTQ